MTKVGIKEYPLVEYLAGQLMLSDEDRLNALKEYFPNAKPKTGACGKPASACRSSSVMKPPVAC
jgi:L-2-hydroxyglutarate oxidase LhgO